MVLKPLEFRDCTFDDPDFRANLGDHEKEIDRTSHEIKQLIREITDVITATATLSRCQKQLAKHLAEFNFDSIGGSQTDDEIIITNSLKEFGRVLSDIEDERSKILENAMSQFVNPLEDFRRDQIGEVKTERKKFDKESTRFYQAQEKHLSMSGRKDENTLREADADLQMQRRHFIQASLRYVKSIQEVHERKKFEFVETLWSFMSAWMRFYKISYDITKDFEGYMRDLQGRVQKVRDSFTAFCAEGETLMNKIQKSSEHPLNTISQLTTGFLYVMEKKAFGTTWTKHYCAYDKTIKQLTMVAFSHQHGRAIGAAEVLRIKSCVRRSNESIEKRFCFDLTNDEKVVYTFQAPSEEERARWMNAMDGKEPIYQQPGKSPKENEFMTDLNEAGFRFVGVCIDTIERRGVSEQGLYRLTGVASKTNRLLHQAFESNERINFADDQMWETKCITSALKTYFRVLPEPLLTYRFHESLIKAAQKENKLDRLNEVHSIVAALPDVNRRMLEILIRHLAKVAANSAKNLMTISNLGVCFGPTLLRPEEESVAALVDIKFCNIIVEILIEHWQKIFLSLPSSTATNEYAALITKLPATPRTVPTSLPTANFLPRSDNNFRINNLHNSKLNSDLNGNSTTTSASSSPGAKPYMDKVVAVPFQPWQPRNGDVYYSTPLEEKAEGKKMNMDKSLDFGNYAQPDTSSGRVKSAIAKLSTPGAYGGSPHATTQFFPVNAKHENSPSKNNHENGSVNSSSASVLHSSPYPPHQNSTVNSTQSPHLSMGSNQSSQSRTPDRNLVPLSSPLANDSPNLSLPVKVPLDVGPQKMPNSGDSVSKSMQSRHHLAMMKNQPSSRRRVRTIYTCHGDPGIGELSFEQNEIISSVRPSHEPGWLYGELRGKVGLLPANYVEELSPSGT